LRFVDVQQSQPPLSTPPFSSSSSPSGSTFSLISEEEDTDERYGIQTVIFPVEDNIEQHQLNFHPKELLDSPSNAEISKLKSSLEREINSNVELKKLMTLKDETIRSLELKVEELGCCNYYQEKEASNLLSQLREERKSKEEAIRSKKHTENNFEALKIESRESKSDPSRERGVLVDYDHKFKDSDQKIRAQQTEIDRLIESLKDAEECCEQLRVDVDSKSVDLQSLVDSISDILG
jgi:hypothetical protein